MRLLVWEILGSNLEPPDYKSGYPEPAELINFSIIVLIFQCLICLSK